MCLLKLWTETSLIHGALATWTCVSEETRFKQRYQAWKDETSHLALKVTALCRESLQKRR